jgi:hypothetical protein
MAKSNIRRIPFTLNLDDPVDSAIWEALEPLLGRHRASQFIRGAIAQALGMGGAGPGLPVVEPRPALPAPRPKRAAQTMPQLPAGDQEGGDNDALARATNNFLNAFGQEPVSEFGEGGRR